MKILTVIEPEAVENVHVYSAKCTDKLRDEVVAALITLDIRFEPGEDIDAAIDDITTTLRLGHNYWHNERFCFEVIKV